MKRYLISFVAPLVGIYVLIAFTEWTLFVDVSEWEPGLRFFSLLFYAFVAGMIFGWPGWERGQR